MKRITRVVLALCVLTACGSAPPVPDDHFYRLVATRSFAAAPARVFDGTLQLVPVSAVGVRRERPIIYSRSPHVSFRQYHYHHWEEPPPALVGRRLLAALEQAGLAESVVAVPTGDAEARLEVEVRRFDRLLDAAGVQAQVTLAAVLRSGNDVAPRLRAIYEASRPAASDTLDDTARAFSEALDAALADLLSDLEAL